MEVLLIGLGIAAKGQQFVCGDTSYGSGVTQTCCPCQFFHPLGCDFGHVAKDPTSACSFTFRYGHCFTISNGP